MIKTLRILIVACCLVALGGGLLALSSSDVSAVDNPCDPVFGLIKLCKSQHGHWSSTCCCCVLH